MFGPRPRTVRAYLNDASIKALTCANETSKAHGPADAAACARAMSAVLADMRDAVDVRAPWLRDKAQVTEVVRLVEDLSRRCTYRLDLGTEGLVMAVVDAARLSDTDMGGDG